MCFHRSFSPAKQFVVKAVFGILDVDGSCTCVSPCCLQLAQLQQEGCSFSKGVDLSKQILSVIGTVPLSRVFQSFSLLAISDLSVLQKTLQS